MHARAMAAKINYDDTDPHTNDTYARLEEVDSIAGRARTIYWGESSLFLLLHHVQDLSPHACDGSAICQAMCHI
jgi:hypothetical protein